MLKPIIPKTHTIHAKGNHAGILPLNQVSAKGAVTMIVQTQSPLRAVRIQKKGRRTPAS
jgi:hypothetical protein